MTHVRGLSPVVPVPGVGQIGQNLQNTWGLEEEEESSGEEEEMKMEEKEDKHKTTKGFVSFKVMSNALRFIFRIKQVIYFVLQLL